MPRRFHACIGGVDNPSVVVPRVLALGEDPVVTALGALTGVHLEELAVSRKGGRAWVPLGDVGQIRDHVCHHILGWSFLFDVSAATSLSVARKGSNSKAS